MDALVVIHAENVGINNGKRVIKPNNDKLFSDIAFEVHKAVSDPNKTVYFLGAKCTSPYSRNMHPLFKPYANKMAFITPGNPVDSLQQFLRTKDILIDEAVGHIEIAGINYFACVSDLYHLLIGQETVKKQFFKDSGQELGWTVEKFDRVFAVKLSARIREDLTDKVYLG